jgi:hypothetical protein
MSDPAPPLHPVIIRGDYSPDDYRALLKQLFREFGHPQRNSQGRWQWEYVWSSQGRGIYASGLRLQFADHNDAIIAALKYKGSL